MAAVLASPLQLTDNTSTYESHATLPIITPTTASDIFSITDEELKDQLHFIREIGFGNWGSVWCVQSRYFSSYCPVLTTHACAGRATTRTRPPGKKLQSNLYIAQRRPLLLHAFGPCESSCVSITVHR